MAMTAANKNDFHTQDDNLETFGLLWLDANVNTSEENRQAQQQLRQTINHLKTFDDQNQCQQYILSVSRQNRLVFIVSGRFGQQIVPHIHHLRQISSIYVYCMDKKGNEKWAKNFTKVKDVIVQLNDLIIQIKSDQIGRIRTEEPLSFNVFSATNNSGQSTTGINGYFVHSLLLFEVLLRMKSIKSGKQQLITLCKNEYKGNNEQLAIIREFEQQYSSDKALWWYTRECFLYKMLNKALRVQNIDLLFLFRFVISDINRQLKQHQCSSSIQVYRGQIMSNDELKNLQRSIGEFISINSFFSTSIRRHKALAFMNSSLVSDDLHRVLFVIKADPGVVKTKPFSDISSISYVIEESEVLFMIGSIFRLMDIRRNDDDNDQLWTIQMKLCDDSEHDLKSLFDHMKKEHGCSDAEVDLRSFGEVLRSMGKFDLAEKMYHRLLAELPPNDPSIWKLYYSLGTVAKDKGEYDLSLQWYYKSLEIIRRMNRSDYINIGKLYNSIGVIHRHKKDDHEALEWYNKAIELFKHNNNDNHPDMASFYNNIAIIYCDQQKYSKALEFYEKSLAIKEKHFPSDHRSLGTTYMNIGSVHYSLKHYDVAMEYYHRSLKISLKSLPPEHPDIAQSYANIASVHKCKGELKQALTYYQKAATIYRHSLPSQHPNVIGIERQIQRVSKKMK